MNHATDRIAEYLRQFRKQTSVDTSIIHTVWTDPEVEPARLLPTDLDDILAALSRIEAIAEWIRDNHGDYISREIEDRIRAALAGDGR